jgi:hypothetical protein
MSNITKLLLSLLLVSFITLLFYLSIKDERKMRNYNMIIRQGNSKYATDKIDTTNGGINFIDHTGKNIHIIGDYIIETTKK